MKRADYENKITDIMHNNMCGDTVEDYCNIVDGILDLFLTDTPPDTTLDTAMRLLRDTKSLHIARELTQVDHDVLRLAQTWGRSDA